LPLLLLPSQRVLETLLALFDGAQLSVLCSDVFFVISERTALATNLLFSQPQRYQ
jgi:hypothetical protein